MLALWSIERITAPYIHRVTSVALLDLLCCRSVHAARSVPHRFSMGIEIPHSGPVPPDYEISRRASLKHISEIAKSLGIEESEYNLYGRYQAKVRIAHQVHARVSTYGPDDDLRASKAATDTAGYPTGALNCPQILRR